MSATYSDNLTAVLGDLDQELPQQDHELVFANNREYAQWLHDKKGYYVFNDMHALGVARDWIADLIASDQPLSDRNITLALDGAGYEEVNFLRSFTGNLRPPVKAGEGPREERQGGWSDITGNLAASYTHRADNGPTRNADDYS